MTTNDTKPVLKLKGDVTPERIERMRAEDAALAVRLTELQARHVARRQAAEARKQAEQRNADVKLARKAEQRNADVKLARKAEALAKQQATPMAKAKLARKAKAAAALAAVAHFNVSVHTADRDGRCYPVNRAAARELSRKRR